MSGGGARAEEDDGAEKTAGDEGRKERQQDQKDDQRVDLQAEEMVEQGDIHTKNLGKFGRLASPQADQ